MSQRIFIDSENARAALIACLVAEMRKDNRSWCGETHIQEAVYFLQEITEVPLPFKFILHKHGPCCFKLRDELTNLRAEGWLELEMADPYAPRFQRTKKRKQLQEEYQDSINLYLKHITFVIEKLENKFVAELERLATALFVSLLPEAADEADELAAEVTKHKPHILPEQAYNAVGEIERLRAEANQRFNLQAVPF